MFGLWNEFRDACKAFTVAHELIEEETRLTIPALEELADELDVEDSATFVGVVRVIVNNPDKDDNIFNKLGRMLF